jgi:hypothetical protein
LVCAVDAIMVIVRLVAYCIMLRFSPRKAIVLLMESRFEDAEPTENSKAMMSFTWMRWLFFILGPLQMSIKLASFQGMTITKTIGFTYLASFILIELLNLIYSMGRSSADMNSHGDMVGFHAPKHISCTLKEWRVLCMDSNHSPVLYHCIFHPLQFFHSNMGQCNK